MTSLEKLLYAVMILIFVSAACLAAWLIRSLA